MYAVHDWAEVHRLHHVEGLSKQAIAVRLGMSRTTVYRLLGLAQPPRYQRAPVTSKLAPFHQQIAALLREDPKVPATVIAQRLRPHGFAGSLTILKDHLRQIRAAFVAAASHQRTSYLPGELAQVDWWHSGLVVPVGKGRTRPAFGLVRRCRTRRRCGWCSPWRAGPRSTAPPCWAAWCGLVACQRGS